MAGVELNGKTFECIDDPVERDKILFQNISALKENCEARFPAIESKLDEILKSPWRLAIPPVSMKAIGLFLIVMALILTGNVERALKLVGLALGIW